MSFKQITIDGLAPSDLNETSTNQVGAGASIDVNQTSPAQLTLSGFADADAFGSPSLKLTLVLAGFAGVNYFGAPTFAVATQTLSLTGFADGDGFGSPTLSPGAVTLTLSGFNDADAFGGATLSPGAALALTGFANSNGFGAPSLGQVLSLSGFADTNHFGSPSLSPGNVTLAPSGFASVNAFGALTLAPAPANLHLEGFTEAHAFGHPTFAPGPVTLELSGLAAANHVGSLRLALNLRLSDFASVNQFGSPQLAPGPVTLHLSGVSEVDRFGNPRLIPGPVTITLTGFDSSNRLGVMVLQAKKKNGQGGGTTPGGVGKAQKYATRLTMTEAGLITALEVQSSVARNVNTRMALYADAGGLPGALISQSAVKTSVVTGSNSYPLLTPRAVLAGVSIWAALHSDGNFNWFLSAGPTSRFNADAFADGPSDPFGASTLQNNKAPVFVVFLAAVTGQLTAPGISDPDQFGGPVLGPQPRTLQLAGFAGASHFGVAALVPDQAISSFGFADIDGFGVLTLAPVSTTIALSGFAGANHFGAPALRQAAATLVLSGFGEPHSFGGLVLTREAGLSVNPALLLKNRAHREREFDNGLDDAGRTLANHAPRGRVLSNPIGGLRRLLVSRQRRGVDA